MVTTFDIPPTPDLIYLFKEHNIYPFLYHIYAKQQIPNSSPPELYIEKYPEFFELIYLSKKSTKYINSNKQLFAKYHKKNTTPTTPTAPPAHLSDIHFEAVLHDKTVSHNFLKFIFKNYRYELSFPVFLKYVKTLLSSDRKRETTDLLASHLNIHPHV